MITNAHQIEHIYDDLGINLDTLGCVMAQMSSPKLNLLDDWLYYSKNPDRFWIKGEVGHDSHVTLRYGFLPGVKREHVDELLYGWRISDIYKKEVIVFDSPYSDEKYKCIVLAMESASLYEAHRLLGFLPNVSTHKNYVAHLTLAYVKEDSVDEAVAYIKSVIGSYQPKFMGLDCGKEIK